jgi:peroxiredoxin
MLRIGTPAPGLDLLDADMERMSLDDLRDRSHLVAYFYPKDDTPGCTIEAIDFSELLDEFERHRCTVVGISRDDCDSHAKFRDKHGLAVRLLCDTDGDVCRAYGVLQTKLVDGQPRETILRSTFVIDRCGILRHALYGVSPRGHAREVLALVRRLKRESAQARIGHRTRLNPPEPGRIP